MMKYGMAAIAAILIAAPATAATTGNPFSADSAVLDLRGLDLTSVDGQQRLEIRMDQAADAVCGTKLSTVHIALGEQARACRADVLADIRSRIATATASADTAKATRLAQR
jgi:UrcA family protein